MVKAIVKSGEIRPLEPLPADWRDGQPLRVEKAESGEPPAEEIDRDFAALESLCAASEPADEEQLEHALQEARRPRGDAAHHLPVRVDEMPAGALSSVSGAGYELRHFPKIPSPEENLCVGRWQRAR